MPALPPASPSDRHWGRRNRATPTITPGRARQHAGSGQRNPEGGMPNAECRVESGEWRVQSAEQGTGNGECRVQSAGCGIGNRNGGQGIEQRARSIRSEAGGRVNARQAGRRDRAGSRERDQDQDREWQWQWVETGSSMSNRSINANRRQGGPARLPIHDDGRRWLLCMAFRGSDFRRGSGGEETSAAASVSPDCLGDTVQGRLAPQGI
jgi:hypothetical protein